MDQRLGLYSDPTFVQEDRGKGLTCISLAFPPHSPQVFELYWLPSQAAARSLASEFDQNSEVLGWTFGTRPRKTYWSQLHAHLRTQTVFAFGSRVMLASLWVRMWTAAVSRGGIQKVTDVEMSMTSFGRVNGKQYDPSEASYRVPVTSDLYGGAGACSMFRTFQGWLSMSHMRPNEGTLMVNPLLHLSIACFLPSPSSNLSQKPSVFAAGDYDPEF
jgi:hypothetical protein